MKNTTLLVQLGDDRDIDRDDQDYIDPICDLLDDACLPIVGTGVDFDEELECEVAVFVVEGSVASSISKVMEPTPFEYVVR